MERIFYVGDQFYLESGTHLSSLYNENGQREDWGKVSRYLANGKTVIIRPATDVELGRMYRKLQEIKTRSSQQ